MNKTYTAPGMLDFQLVLHAGAAWVTVAFRGGRSAGYGNYSAQFTTDDASLQYLIEHSPEFKSHRVKILPDYQE